MKRRSQKAISKNPYYKVRSIAVVRNEVKEPGQKDWNEIISEIKVDDDLAEALKGIEEFSNVYVLYYLHKRGEVSVRTIKPRKRDDMPEVGVLASRSPNHPNPLGLTLVELLEKKGNTLVVKGLDAIDGTPIIDIKPYNGYHDSVNGERIPKWLRRLIKESEEEKSRRGTHVLEGV